MALRPPPVEKKKFAGGKGSKKASGGPTDSPRPHETTLTVSREISGGAGALEALGSLKELLTHEWQKILIPDLQLQIMEQMKAAKNSEKHTKSFSMRMMSIQMNMFAKFVIGTLVVLAVIIPDLSTIFRQQSSVTVIFIEYFLATSIFADAVVAMFQLRHVDKSCRLINGCIFDVVSSLSLFLEPSNQVSVRRSGLYADSQDYIRRSLCLRAQIWLQILRLSRIFSSFWKWEQERQWRHSQALKMTRRRLRLVFRFVDDDLDGFINDLQVQAAGYLCGISIPPSQPEENMQEENCGWASKRNFQKSEFLNSNRSLSFHLAKSTAPNFLSWQQMKNFFRRFFKAPETSLGATVSFGEPGSFEDKIFSAEQGEASWSRSSSQCSSPRKFPTRTPRSVQKFESVTRNCLFQNRKEGIKSVGPSIHGFPWSPIGRHDESEKKYSFNDFERRLVAADKEQNILNLWISQKQADNSALAHTKRTTQKLIFQILVTVLSLVLASNLFNTILFHSSPSNPSNGPPISYKTCEHFADVTYSSILNKPIASWSLPELETYFLQSTEPICVLTRYVVEDMISNAKANNYKVVSLVSMNVNFWKTPIKGLYSPGELIRKEFNPSIMDQELFESFDPLTECVYDCVKWSRLVAVRNLTVSVVCIVFITLALRMFDLSFSSLQTKLLDPLDKLTSFMEDLSFNDFTYSPRGSKSEANSVTRETRIGHSSNTENRQSEDIVHEILCVEKTLARLVNGVASFARFVPRPVVSSILRKGEEAELGVRHRDLTVLFSDIESFTSLAEIIPASDLLRFLNQYFQEMSDLISHTGGTLVEFIGDAILAVWNAPVKCKHHARAALFCALQMVDQASKIEVPGVPSWEVKIRIGVHSDEVLVGNLGSNSRIKYGVLGDGVNLTSRLEELNKLYHTSILTTYECMSRKGVAETFLLRPVDAVIVKGRKDPTYIFEVLAITSEASVKQKKATKLQVQGFHMFLEKRFEKAVELFTEADVMTGVESSRLCERAKAFLENPPLEDESLAVALKTKAL